MLLFISVIFTFNRYLYYMGTKKKLFFITLMVALLQSCVATRVSSHANNLPTKSFVQIFHAIDIKSCKNKNDPTCPKGTHYQTGSGMAIDLVPKKMIVLTAGHVCDTQPSDNIDKYLQVIYVLDHNNMKHQAWTINVSFFNDAGSADLCLLWVPTLKVKKVKISKIGPKIGDELYYIGAPLGIYHPPTVPVFKGLYSGKINPSSGMVTFPSAGGSSGGAVLNKNLKIVGVVFAANRQFHHISLITSHESLILFLSESISKIKSQ